MWLENKALYDHSQKWIELIKFICVCQLNPISWPKMSILLKQVHRKNGLNHPETKRKGVKLKRPKKKENEQREGVKLSKQYALNIFGHKIWWNKPRLRNHHRKLQVDGRWPTITTKAYRERIDSHYRWILFLFIATVSD